MSQAVLESIREWLRREAVAFRELHHEPTRTSEESARVRGEDVRVGGKALLVKAGDRFRLLVLSAALKLDSSAVKSHFGVKSVRFATPAELEELTGLVPGAVPPFGKPILPFDLYVDPSITQNERIAFNAGSLTDSVIMAVPDYLRLAQPRLLPFAGPG